MKGSSSSPIERLLHARSNTMEFMTVKTYSQGSDLWKPQPITLNCPVMQVVTAEAPLPVVTGSFPSAGPASGKATRSVKARPQHQPGKSKADLIADQIHA